MKPHTTHSRDSAVRRLSLSTRWMIAGSVALTGALSEVAAQAFPGKTLKVGDHTLRAPPRRVLRTSPLPKLQSSSSSLAAPSQAPAGIQPNSRRRLKHSTKRRRKHTPKRRPKPHAKRRRKPTPKRPPKRTANRLPKCTPKRRPKPPPRPGGARSPGRLGGFLRAWRPLSQQPAGDLPRRGGRRSARASC